MLSDVPVVVDASSLINLAASGHLAELLASLSHQCSICPIVKEECLYVRSIDGTQTEPLHPTQWIDGGLLVESELAENEEERFVAYAARIDDGEAMSLAIAEARGYVLVTDDRKAKQLAEANHIRTITTAAVVKEWSKGKKNDEVAQVLTAIENRARFRPPEDDVDYNWWSEHSQ